MHQAMSMGRARRRAAIAVAVAAAVGATMMAQSAGAATHKPHPTSTTTPTGSKPTPSPTYSNPPIPPIPSAPPPPSAKAYCTSYDVTAPGQCIEKAKAYTETITYPNPAPPYQMITAKVPAIRPLTSIDVLTGKDGDTQKRITVPSVCTYFRTYTGQRLATYPAPDAFLRVAHPRPSSYWIKNYDGPPKNRYFFQMQLPDGIGKVEAPSQNFYTRKQHEGVNESYDDWIHLDYYNPKANDDAYSHMTDNTGYWWSYQCSFARYRNLVGTSTPDWLKNTLHKLHAQNPYYWEFWQPGQEDPPEVPTPTLPLPSILKLVVPNLDLSVSPPPTANIVQLKSFLWINDEMGRYPITIKDGNGDTATATPDPKGLRLISQLPDGTTKSLSCTDGGAPNPSGADSQSDCWIKFVRATAQDTPLHVTLAQDWKVTVNGKAVQGATGIITKKQNIDFTIRQAQAVGGN